jgi:predicted DNA-binding protein
MEPVKRKVGRPMVNKRTEYVSLPLFLEEKNRLKNLATKLNLPVSTILRNSVFEFIKKMDAES